MDFRVREKTVRDLQGIPSLIGEEKCDEEYGCDHMKKEGKQMFTCNEMRKDSL